MHVCVYTSQRTFCSLSLSPAPMWGLSFAQAHTCLWKPTTQGSDLSHLLQSCNALITRHLHGKPLNVMVKNTNSNPSYLLLSPSNGQLQSQPHCGQLQNSCLCLLQESKEHLHCQITLTSKCILNTHQQGKQEQVSYIWNIFLKRAPEF